MYPVSIGMIGNKKIVVAYNSEEGVLTILLLNSPSHNVLIFRLRASDLETIMLTLYRLGTANNRHHQCVDNVQNQRLNVFCKTQLIDISSNLLDT
ncbi:hypothetical protein EVAR_61646_1 [Eumeta japonica]|uniref:Uncharacterized protein n=1 Tax=Eumeta variegata TaxID=151549 RepID=A0A4C1Z4I7_EUMVA|nr:hypothetical protein EVAR_61646_1 [Eumeta japonica]